MPWLTQWVDPAVFTRHRGITIYHTYTDMEATSGAARFCFTTSENDGDPRWYFDVRELPLASTARLRALDPGSALDHPRDHPRGHRPRPAARGRAAHDVYPVKNGARNRHRRVRLAGRHARLPLAGQGPL